MSMCLGLTYRGMFNETFKICIYPVAVYGMVHGIYFRMMEKCQIS